MSKVLKGQYYRRECNDWVRVIIATDIVYAPLGSYIRGHYLQVMGNDYRDITHLSCSANGIKRWGRLIPESEAIELYPKIKELESQWLANHLYDKLTYKWSKRHKDYLINYPRKCDGHLVNSFFAGYIDSKEFLKELEARGYDLKTLKFEVKLATS